MSTRDTSLSTSQQRRLRQGVQRHPNNTLVWKPQLLRCKQAFIFNNLPRSTLSRFHWWRLSLRPPSHRSNRVSKTINSRPLLPQKSRIVFYHPIRASRPFPPQPWNARRLHIRRQKSPFNSQVASKLKYQRCSRTSTESSRLTSRLSRVFKML